MARGRRGRPVDGILVLDKPQGLTSNEALQQVKRLYFAAKAGHTGSLDPLATGVLPLCFGEATKFSQYLLDADKTYRATVVFGVSTDSGDADGRQIATADAGALTEQQLQDALAPFRGEIAQVPSMFSAIKVDGTPLYKLARQGVEIEREARQVTVHRLELLAFRPGPQAEAEFLVEVSKGTYIRSLAEDIGRALGVGAHVKALRRTQAGPYRIEQAQSLDSLEELRGREAFAELDALLLPVASALEHLPDVVLPEVSGFYVRQGQPVQVSRAPVAGLVRLRLEDGGFLGVGEILDDGRVAPRRLLNSSAV